jgi:hypothetical protein
MPFEQFSGHGPQDPDPGTLCDRITAALSSVMTYLLTGFAFHAAGLHPELTWPLMEEPARKEAETEAQPDGSSMHNVAVFRPRQRIG